MNRLTYKGYTGVVEYDAESRTLHGTVIDLRDGITFQSTSAEDIEREFRRSVDEYLLICKERGRRPDKPFSGKLAPRMPPALHRRVATKARLDGVSLNQFVVSALERQVE